MTEQEYIESLENKCIELEDLVAKLIAQTEKWACELEDERRLVDDLLRVG